MGRHVKVGTMADFPAGQLVTVDVEGTSVVLSRTGDTVCAARNRCPHLGLPLSKGPAGVRFEDGVVQCPWHNSRFELCSGKNVDWVTGFAGRSIPGWSRRLVALGRQPAPLTTYRVTVDGEDVLVEL